MSDDPITRTIEEENPWYKLAFKRKMGERSNYFWNGYMRHLMESEGQRIAADEFRIIEFDGKENSLPSLAPDELNDVLAIHGLPEKLDKISFDGCVFNNPDFASFYFPTHVTFSNASFKNPTNFRYANFGDEADFSKARFLFWAHFTNTSFAGRAHFTDASFEGPTDFTDASFADGAHFSEARFADITFFKCTSFEAPVDFSKIHFAGRAHFTDASFTPYANFKYANFENNVDFNNARFGGRTDFNNASFVKNAFFEYARFVGRADFGKADFKGEANFSTSSDTPPHKGPVSFASATFKLAPSFFERQLHEDTDWQGVTWPRPSSKEQASHDVRRYECLSLMMSRLEKYDDMHTFFCLSMRAKEIRDGRWSLASIMSRIYGAGFDYGWGVKCAFRLWFGHILLGFLFILGLMFIKGELQSINAWQSLVLSFSNAHSFIGFHSGLRRASMKTHVVFHGSTLSGGCRR